MRPSVRWLLRRLAGQVLDRVDTRLSASTFSPRHYLHLDTHGSLWKHLQCEHLSFPRWSGLQDSFLFLEYLLLPLHTKHTQHSIVLVPHKKYLFCECGDCTCMWMYMYGGVHACLPTCMWRPKADMKYFLDKSSPYLLRQDLSLKVELASSVGWASQFAPGLSLHISSSMCVLGNPNSVPTFAWQGLPTASPP